MRKVLYLLFWVATITSCVNNQSQNATNNQLTPNDTIVDEVMEDGFSPTNNSNISNDENVTESVEKEQALREMGMDGAANIERRAREEYNDGGGYTSEDGSRQIHYQGSKEQKRDLEMIDAYFNEHGWD
jgi:hypothetical protein